MNTHTTVESEAAGVNHTLTSRVELAGRYTASGGPQMIIYKGGGGCDPACWLVDVKRIYSNNKVSP